MIILWQIYVYIYVKDKLNEVERFQTSKLLYLSTLDGERRV